MTVLNGAIGKRRLSQIAPLVLQSEIRSMTLECERVGGVNMAQGVCDTELPPLVAEAAAEAIRAGKNTYTRQDGIAALRQAIAVKLKAYNGIEADPETEIMVTAGATGGLYTAALALLDPGDEIILFEPFYGYHWNVMRSMRVQPVAVPLTAPDWKLDVERLRAAITPKTRAILINTPTNPTGKVFSLAEMQAIAELAIEHDLFVFADEIYEYFLFGGAKHISMATLPGMRDRTITISGVSKTFSMTGWRVGYVAASREWMSTIGYFNDLVYICAPGPLQYGVAAGLVGLPSSFYADHAREYEQKRDQICAALLDAGMPPSIPQGAYYVLADVSRVPGTTSAEKARRLLQDTGVAAVAGSAFFRPGGGENLVRFCFGKKDEALERACAALRAY
jgi:aminotransferase